MGGKNPGDPPNSGLFLFCGHCAPSLNWTSSANCSIVNWADSIDLFCFSMVVKTGDAAL